MSLFSNENILICERLLLSIEQCEILSEISNCDEIHRNKSELDGIDETTNRNYYNVVKRDTNVVERNNVNMRIKIYNKVSKGLGRIDNFEIVNKVLKTNEQVQNRLNSLRINVKHMNLEEKVLCRSGYILKRNVCGMFKL